MGILDRVLGHPFVFEHVRPLAVGGVDMGHAYHRLDVSDDSVVIDIGCGTGDALKHLARFDSYLGIDTDPRAIAFATERWKSRPNVRFESRLCTAADLRDVAPTHVALIGLLHHLSDPEALDVLGMLHESPRLVRAVTLDIVYLPGRPYNNLMARFDRGKHCRTPDGYAELATNAGRRIVDRY
ncbi:MAG TPA: class I SAM-dependent methyltransferase, partial [Polyangiaceae bacterium]|nr:class I SAM-dependent methyltransferase [Polyangiaceae bacterium]